MAYIPITLMQRIHPSSIEVIDFNTTKIFYRPVALCHELFSINAIIPPAPLFIASIYATLTTATLQAKTTDITNNKLILFLLCTKIHSTSMTPFHWSGIWRWVSFFSFYTRDSLAHKPFVAQQPLRTTDLSRSYIFTSIYSLYSTMTTKICPLISLGGTQSCRSMDMI